MEAVGNEVTHSYVTRGRELHSVAYKPHGSVLTPREIQVLRLLADGLSTRAVAVQLNVAFKTAACHRYRILQKLGVESTVSAVRWAIREGLIIA